MGTGNGEQELERRMKMGNGNLKPMEMGNRNGEWEQRIRTESGEPEMGNREWKTGMGNRE